MKIGNKIFEPSEKTYVMGILNVTPDSFSDGGSYTSIDKAMEQTEKMIQQGADIIDVGGESTRPGHVQIGDEEEIKRVVPVIREIKKKFDIPVSIDTYKSAVAKAALEAGADLLNDIWGFRYDEKMAELAAEYDVPVIMDLDIGHLSPMMPVICGAKAKVHSKGNTFDMEYILE